MTQFKQAPPQTGLASPPSAPATEREALQARFKATRRLTEDLAADLGPEDQTPQSMTDASPTKWHRAHTTWFFETFLLKPHLSGYTPFHERFGFLFNSYYEAVGARHARQERGLVTRPTCVEVTDYRDYTDQAMQRLFLELGDAAFQNIAYLIDLGINHEQQHQELLLTDILHLFSRNSLYPAFREGRQAPDAKATDINWIDFDGASVDVGHAGTGFAFDNEGPRHQVLLRPFRLAARPVNNAEFLAFIEDGGYTEPAFWLSDGWALVQAEDWAAPLYWQKRDGAWWQMTLSGLKPLDPAAPVTQISFYEADAYAAWAGKRLPLEAEWEQAAAQQAPVGNTLGTGYLRPVAMPDDQSSNRSSNRGPGQLFGDVWEWTADAYRPYPGFKAAKGAVGEYNGKFMANQFVLKGGSCATPDGHIRASYRNFFYPHQRWQFSGLRLAEDA